MTPSSTAIADVPTRRSKLGLAPVVVALIRLYQLSISPVLGPHCRFAPSCSAYAAAAITKHGVRRGGWLALRRLMQCHPWHQGGWDPVP